MFNYKNQVFLSRLNDRPVSAYRLFNRAFYTASKTNKKLFKAAKCPHQSVSIQLSSKH